MNALKPKYYFNGILVYDGYQLPRAKSQWYIGILENKMVLPATWDMIVSLKWEYDEVIGCLYAWLLYCKSQYNRSFVFSPELPLLSYLDYEKKYYEQKEDWQNKRIRENERLARLFDRK